MGLCLRDPTDPGAWVANMADFTHLYTDRSGWGYIWPGVGGSRCIASCQHRDGCGRMQAHSFNEHDPAEPRHAVGPWTTVNNRIVSLVGLHLPHAGPRTCSMLV